MPLSPNEIRSRAIAFSREWRDAWSENADAKLFWNGFFSIFGITLRRIASFEKPVKKADGKGGFIDLLWKGMLLVEHKSRGLDLDRAFHQATEYFHGLKERDLPRYVIVSDFARFRLYDLEADQSETNPVEFPLADLHKNISRFGFISGYQTHTYPQREVDVEAAEELGKLHDLLRDAGYTGHALEVFLVRILFCLFAENNGVFEAQQFRDWIDQRTSEDGSDLGPQLNYLFEILNKENRPMGLDEQLAAFRYINGGLFEEHIDTAPTDARMRAKLLECSGIKWSKVSPAIFGALFQSIMDKKARRNSARITPAKPTSSRHWSHSSWTTFARSSSASVATANASANSTKNSPTSAFSIPPVDAATSSLSPTANYVCSSLMFFAKSSRTSRKLNSTCQTSCS